MSKRACLLYYNILISENYINHYLIHIKKLLDILMLDFNTKTMLILSKKKEASYVLFCISYVIIWVLTCEKKIRHANMGWVICHCNWVWRRVSWYVHVMMNLIQLVEIFLENNRGFFFQRPCVILPQIYIICFVFEYWMQLLNI